MPRRLFRSNGEKTVPSVLPESLGGSGVSSKSSVVGKLNAIPKFTIGKENGLVPLDANSKIPESFFPTLPNGSSPRFVMNTTVSVGSSMPCAKGNADISEENIEITVRYGSIFPYPQRVGVYIYNAPNFPCTDVITMQGKDFFINVVDGGGNEPPPA